VVWGFGSNGAENWVKHYLTSVSARNHFKENQCHAAAAKVGQSTKQYDVGEIDMKRLLLGLAIAGVAGVAGLNMGIAPRIL
jgi:hypothetical protein